MSASTPVLDLLARFNQHRDTYSSGRYNETMLRRDARSAKTPHEKEALERQIAATDQQIDRLVYELYGLTEDEIRIVETS